MKKKILILSASPARDKIVDTLISEELIRLGNKVQINPCLREGRKAVLEMKPDVVVLPPVRNPYSRDFADVIKRWGMGLVVRHTEASCDWKDWKKVDKFWQAELLGRWKYSADVEIVWGDDEAEILNRRGAPFKAVPVGALVVDIYHKKDFDKRFLSREDFNKRYKFDPKKKTLLVGAPWGFADSAPDLQIPEIKAFNEDEEWRKIHLGMIAQLKQSLSDKWNIVLRPHPGVLTKSYEDFAKKLNIPLDNQLEAVSVLKNSDALIHSGSTMAIEAHLLNIPAFQFGDVNRKHPKNWWLIPETAMSRISKIYGEPQPLIEAIKEAKPQTNANKNALKELEKGRYGKMDGKATARAAKIINEVGGKFKLSWPLSPHDYNQPAAVKTLEDVAQPVKCGVCGESFFKINPEWVEKWHKLNKFPLDAVKHFGDANCPHCCARFFAPPKAKG